MVGLSGMGCEHSHSRETLDWPWPPRAGARLQRKAARTAVSAASAHSFRRCYGTELTCNGHPALVDSSHASNGTTSHRASRMQNAFVESFNGRLRDELLNETLFSSLQHARELLAEWQDDYNTVRPHSGIGNLPPSTYARLTASDMQQDGTLRCVEGSAPRPVASPSHSGSNDQRILPIAG